MPEKFIPPEARGAEQERTIEGEEREKFIKELQEYIEGLETALSDPDLPEGERADIEEQLAGLKDSYEQAQAGGEIKYKNI